MGERLFVQNEKEFITHLNSHPGGTSIQNYLDPSLSRISVFVSQGKKEVFFRFATQSVSPTPQELGWIKSSSDELQLKLVELTRFLGYLESNGLVYAFVPAYHQTSTIQFGQCPTNSTYVSYKIYDPQTICAVIELVDKTILPTPSLSNLQRCHFRFPEEVRFAKSKKLSWIGIWVAIVLSLMAIASSLYLSYVSSKVSDRDFQAITGYLNQIRNNSSDIATKESRILQLLENQAVVHKLFDKEVTNSILPSLNHQLEVINNTLSYEAKMTQREIDMVRVEISNILSNQANSAGTKSRAAD